MNIIENFSSLNEFLRVVGNRTPNKVFKKECLASETGSKSFTMTNTYKESVELMTTGYEEGLSELINNGNGLNSKFMSRCAKYIPTTSVVGFTPHVPNAITGNPFSMISTRSVRMKTKTIHIVYDGGAACSIDAEEFVTAGQNLINMILQLELKGYRVKLDIIQIFALHKEKAFCLINVKDYRQPINPLKLSYFLIHPSFFSRQGFRWLETTPSLSDYEFTGGYGRPLKFIINSKDKSGKDVGKYLHDNKIIKEDASYISIYEAMRLKPEDLIKEFELINI